MRRGLRIYQTGNHKHKGKTLRNLSKGFNIN